MMDHKIFYCFHIFISTIDNIFGWKPEELSEGTITTPTTSDNSFALKLI